MSITLNRAENQQAQAFLSLLRADVPNHPQPARAYIPLIRARVCAWLNEQVETGNIVDVFVDRTQEVDLYFHI